MPPTNVPAPDTPYFTPAQFPPAGSAINPSTDAGYVILPHFNFSADDSNGDSATSKNRPIPTLFTPIQIRSLSFQNRIFVAPMCQYSCANSGPTIGALTPYHLVHLGGLAFRGASLVFIEASAVQPNGRISPHDSGLWDDAQIDGIAPVATFVHSQGQKLGIQLAHAGRKSSTVPPWLAPRGKVVRADESVGGWPNDVKGASAIPHSDAAWTPKELTLEDIEEVKLAFVQAAQRAVKAGIDVIEIHAAHGYLLCSFLSPLSNQRTDKYGGSFANRVRLVIEVCQAVRAAIPAGMPLFLRISATEWMEHEYAPGQSWDLEQAIELAKTLPSIGVDLLDVSSGGNNSNQRLDRADSTYQIGLAGRIRSALKESGINNLLIGAVGMIVDGVQAESILEKDESVSVTARSSAANGSVLDGKIETDQQEPVSSNSKKRKVDDEAAIGANGHSDESLTIEDENGQIAKADVVLVARQFLREPEWVLRTAMQLEIDVRWPNQYSRGTFRKGTV